MRRIGSLIAVVMFFLLLTAQSAMAQSDELVAKQFRAKGLQHQQRGDYSKALFYYTQASVLNPGDPSAFNDMGMMQEHLGNLDEAERNYRQALDSNRLFLPAVANLGYLYSRQGQYSLALQFLKERVSYGSSTDPWTKAAENEIERIYKEVPNLNRERVQKAAAELEIELSESKKRFEQKMARAKSVDFETAYQNGLKALDERRYGDAVMTLENALAVEPRNAQARHALRRAKFELEKELLESDAEVIRAQMKEDALTSTIYAMTGEYAPRKVVTSVAPASM